MSDELLTRFNPSLSGRILFHPDDASILLYGMDDTQGVVAVESAGLHEVVLFKRDSGGNTTTERRIAQPWLVAAHPALFDNKPGIAVTELRGQHPYRFLVTFASWAAYRVAVSRERLDLPDIVGPSSQVAQYLIRSGVTLFKGMDYRDLRRMQLDLETLSLDASTDDAGIVMISLRQGNAEEVLVLEASEAELLERLNEAMTRFDPDVIEGHNLYRFDFPYLLERARQAGVTLRLGRDGSVPRVVDNGRRQPTVFIYGRHVVDTYVQIQRFDVQGRLTRYGLKEVIHEMGLEREGRTFVDREVIAHMWRSSVRDRETLTDYALDDVRDVDVLSRVIMPTEFYQTQMLPVTYQRGMMTGTGRKIDDLMLRSYLAAGHSLPRPQRSRAYAGGYVELVQTGTFERVVKCDVESLYPSIMLAEHIVANADVLQAFPLLLRDLTERRINAKRQVTDATGEERAAWQGLQGSLKILINSFYGYLGFSGGAFNDYDAAERVTLEGQRLIREVLQRLRDVGAEPIEVDTDGAYFSPPASVRVPSEEEAFILAISDRLPEGIRLAHDGRFKHMLSLKQKTYALIDYHGTLTLTGSALRSRALEKCFRAFIRDAARAFMEQDQNAVKDLYFTLAAAIQRRSLNVHDISQWTMLRQDTIRSRTRLNTLLESVPGRWRYGDRIEIYEREDGTLALAEDYANDENTNALLKRLRDVAERFRPVFMDQAAFDATFPRIKATTDLEAAMRQEVTRQLGLF